MKVEIKLLIGKRGEELLQNNLVSKATTLFHCFIKKLITWTLKRG